MLQAWKRFIEGQPPSGELSRSILESWERCRAYEVDTARASLNRLPLPELQARLTRNAALLDAARGHLRWALASTEPVSPVVVMLTDADGIILESVGNAPQVMTSFGLIPGYDWSERAMGTNGIGTALAFGAPVAVIGTEHYKQTWHNNTCVGAPLRAADGRILGAVDISTTAADGDPARLVLVSYLAHLISRDLGEAHGSVRVEAFAGPEVLARASGTGSSAGLPALEHHARELEAWSTVLGEAARAGTAPLLPHSEDVALDALVRDVAGGYEGVRVDVGAGPLLVRGSAERLERLVEHLVGLGTRPGGTLAVRLDRADGEVTLELWTGAPAAPPEGKSSRLEQTGTALGRWIARELTQALGGTFQAGDEVPLRYTARFPAAPVHPART